MLLSKPTNVAHLPSIPGIVGHPAVEHSVSADLRIFSAGEPSPALRSPLGFGWGGAGGRGGG
jgi:hypothetical protein